VEKCIFERPCEEKDCKILPCPDLLFINLQKGLKIVNLLPKQNISYLAVHVAFKQLKINR